MNILSTIRDQLSPEVLGQIGRSVGETPEATKSALDQTLPALLGSAASRASSPEGATSLFNLLKEKTPQGGWPSSISGLLGNLTGTGMGGVGSALVTALLGSKAGLIRDFIASRSGIRAESASSLLGTGGQMLSGILGRQVTSQGLGASSFGQLLRSQVPHLQGFLSPELAGMLGIGNLLSGGKPAAATTSYATPVQATEPEHVVQAGVPSTSRVLRWALIPLALLLGGIFLVNRHNREASMGGTRDDTTWTTSRVTTLPHVDTANLADRLKTAIASGDGSSVNLEGVNFDSTGNLSAVARSPLSLLGKMINANPDLKATITAYGKTSEDAASRANAIKSALVNSGVPTERVTVQPEVGDAYPKVSFTK
jgi:hypothetical protein